MASMTDEEILTHAEAVFDSYFANDPRIDWERFIERLEERTEHDFGNSMVSPLIKKVQRHVREYRKL